MCKFVTGMLLGSLVHLLYFSSFPTLLDRLLSLHSTGKFSSHYTLRGCPTRAVEQAKAKNNRSKDTTTMVRHSGRWRDGLGHCRSTDLKDLSNQHCQLTAYDCSGRSYRCPLHLVRSWRPVSEAHGWPQPC